MASWEDGPEYAPLQRPDEFALPQTAPLEVVPPVTQSAALAPKERPAFDGPQAAVPALATLIPKVPDQRDPATPFDVASSTVTSMDSAWGAAHWSPPSGPPVTPSAGSAQPPAAGPAAATTWAPPVTAPWPAPTAPFPSVNGPAQIPGGFPPPGTPQWFGPGPAMPPQAQPAPPLDPRAVLNAATPGLAISLAIGGLIHPFAPILLGVAFVLSQRVKVAVQPVRWAFFTAIGFLLVFAVVGALSDPIGIGDWWSSLSWAALVLCWALLVTVLVLVARGLSTSRPQPPPYTSNWG